MDNFLSLLALLGGLLLRIGIPALITGFLVYMFTRLDAQWKAEAEQARRAQVKMLLSIDDSSRCWNIMGCEEKNREKCLAYLNKDSPCWQAFRTEDGLLKDRCLTCKVFKGAEAPLAA
jgi:hypothetical protein